MGQQMRYAIVNDNSKKVVNVIEWDGQTEFTPPKDHHLKQDDFCAKEDVWIEEMGCFCRPLKTIYHPLTPEQKTQQEGEFKKQKELLKAEILFVNPVTNELEA